MNTVRLTATLEAAGLRFTYPPPGAGWSAPAVLRDVTLHLDAGESLAVLGASSSGKSTLCHVLAGLAPRYTGGTLAGTVHLAGHDPAAGPLPSGLVGLLFQEAAAQLFTTTVEDEIAWGLEALAAPPAEIGPRVDEALARFGLETLRSCPPWALSGGQQKRLALAAIWVMRPALFLLDEPLDGLDPAGQTEVAAALESLRQGGTTLLVTTPGLPAARLTARAALLEEGTLTAPEPTAALLAQEERLVAAGLLFPAAHWPDLRGQPPLEGPPAVEVRNLRFHYPDGPEILRGLDLTIPQGQFVTLVGVNGAGKTTLVRHFNGLLRPSGGSVTILGQPTAGRPIGALARQVGFLFQRPEQQLFAPTVREEVSYGPQRLRLPDVETRVARALARFNLEPVAALPPAVLSYGLRRAVTLAALAALETPILVLDEPTTGLDGYGWAQLLHWLAERRAAGVTLIVVTHEPALAACADRLIAMEAGQVIYDGPPAESAQPSAISHQPSALSGQPPAAGYRSPAHEPDA